MRDDFIDYPFNDDIPYSSLTFCSSIGGGGYATVYKGYFSLFMITCSIWDDKVVALKKMKENISPALIMKEVSIQRVMHHKSILPLYGISRCTENGKTQYVLVLELADYSLQSAPDLTKRRYMT